ncbi:MAG: hypothetical protein KDC53_23735, partial [Saprospiraceae bacterium]|nr:hypothetical protein [Saprospiraceae bacterium]
TKSADELGEYIGYALQVLKDAGLHCDGVTTPGGFGSRNIPNLARGTQMAVRDVFGGRVAHFFRDVVTDINQSVQPQVFHAEGLESEEASCSVHIIGCTGDWFGGWDGLNPGDPDRFITPDLNEGRMVEVIESGEPAIMVCHWPGIYYNGDKVGFNIFKTVVSRLHEKYDHLIWLKLSEISSYWAAKEFTRITNSGNQLEIWAPFECTDFTIQIPGPWKNPVFKHGEKTVLLSRVNSSGQLAMNTWCPEQEETILTFDLPRGKSTITFD